MMISSLARATRSCIKCDFHLVLKDLGHVARNLHCRFHFSNFSPYLLLIALSRLFAGRQTGSMIGRDLTLAFQGYVIGIDTGLPSAFFLETKVSQRKVRGLARME